MGLGGFPASHEQWLGMLGMHGTRTANYAMDNADLIVCVGARFDDRITGKLSEFAPRAKFVHIDIDPAEISKNVPAHIPIVGDVKEVLPKLVKEYRASQADRSRLDPWWEQIRAWQKEYPLQLRATPRTPRSSPRRWSRRCSAPPTATRSSPRTSASTRCGRRSTTASTSRAAGSTPAGSGTMGFGLPAAIGAKVAQPDDTVVCLAGDGSLIMTCQELATAVRHEIPVKVFLMNNGYFGMVRQWQELFWDGRYSSVEMGPSPDWAKLADAFGAKGMQVDDKSEVEGAMRDALATEGPVLLDVRVTKEENCYPMIPAGAAARDMVGWMEAGTPDLIKLEDLDAAAGALTGRKHVLSILVENRPGVLARIAGLFSRRGFNIDTLAVGPTEDPEISRITLTVDGAVHPIDQVTKQLHKLVNVIKIRDMEPGETIAREMALFKVSAPIESRAEIMQFAEIFRAKIVDVSRRSLTDRGDRQRRQDRGLRADDPPPRADRDGPHGRGRDRPLQVRQLGRR